MSWMLAVTGLAIIAFTLLDLVVTTLTMEGAGPASNPVSRITWKCFRLADRWLDSFWLRMLKGPVTLIVMILFWLLTTWLGWVLVFCWDGVQVINTTTQQGASLVELIYYIGYTMTTVGYGDFRVLGTPGRFASVVAGFNGLFLLTLAITYSIQVLTAVVEKRRLALLLDIMKLGRHETTAPSKETVQRIETVADQLASLHVEIAGMSQKYLAYPIILGFYDRSARICLPLNIKRLYTFLEKVVVSQELPLTTREQLEATQALVRILIIDAMSRHWDAFKNSDSVQGNIDQQPISSVLMAYVVSSGWDMEKDDKND